MKACRIKVSGQVQGVGYRPFIYRLASELHLCGTVRNLAGTVEILIEGEAAALDQFIAALEYSAPPLAKATIAQVDSVNPIGMANFHIEPSENIEPGNQSLPPDLFVCADCLAEMADPEDRRYRYPFINCTQCGPRYTIIDALPYDRIHTSMAGFAMCRTCQSEFEDSSNRRFHAQPIACPECGPQLTLQRADLVVTEDNALTETVALLRKGKILAVKGVGGYHLMCDAQCEQAVLTLRERKRRPDKPLAVMFPMEGKSGLNVVTEHVVLDPAIRATLLDPRRPIVLAPQRQQSTLAELIAPRLQEIGVVLPYSPLHHLLLQEFAGPLVATSANISGEPVLTDPVEVETRLAAIADAFLHHDRPIVRPADDSVFRPIRSKLQPLRIGRGHSPLELSLTTRLEQPVLALGGHQKVAIALGLDNRLIVSPHIGDLGSQKANETLAHLVTDFPRLFGVSPTTILCDNHPDFASLHRARKENLPIVRIPHHFAHASALAMEHPEIVHWLIFTWDGIGLGLDETLWGGEALVGQPGNWQRFASWRPFYSVGLDRVGREPWRSAAALLWDERLKFPRDIPALPLAKQAWDKQVWTLQTSAVGRLFDAAASLVLGRDFVSYEGQGPMELEALAGNELTSPILLPLVKSSDGTLRSDWAPLLPMLMDERITPAQRASCFHASLARAACDQVQALRKTFQIDAVGLAGGVFQNRLLSEMMAVELEHMGLQCLTASKLPCNDGGLAAGQIAEYAASMQRGVPHG